MKKIFSKIIIGTLVAGFFLAPISGNIKKSTFELVITKKEVFAITVTFSGLNGSGKWSGVNNDGTFSGTVIDHPAGSYTGTISVSGGGTWAGTVDANGSITGTWHSNTPFTGPSNGDWQGFDLFSGNGIAGTGITGTSTTNKTEVIGNDYDFKCISLTSFSLSGCIAGFLQIVWSYIAAPIMRLGGAFLDFFVYYSTNSDSYTGAFVEQGWAVIRDIANLFFIIALLYVAFKIILNDTHSNAKRMVGMIIIMALIINFSLFATRVVIDASNILAKIFYNNINSVGANGQALPPDKKKEKSISVGMVAKFNPQEVVTQDAYNKEGGVGIFILTALVLIIICIYAAFIFFSVGLLFVARVVSLWIAMIFSPIAFASKATSFENKMGSMGFGQWFSDLIKNAMLAPVFIFFLYLIVLFLNIKDFISYDAGGTTTQKIMHVIIPFMILAGLLTKAKKIAVDMSGEMGKTVQGMGAAIGGLALGGAALGGAALGRKVIGQASAKWSNMDGAVARGEALADYNSAMDKYKKDKTQPKPADSFKDHLASKNAVLAAAGKPTVNYGDDKNWRVRVGASINAAQIRVSKAEHSQHDWAELKKKSGLEGKPDESLGGTEFKTMEKNFGIDKKSEFEANVRKGTDGTEGITLKEERTKADGTIEIIDTGIKGEDQFKVVKRKQVEDEMFDEKTIDPVTGKSNLEKNRESGDIEQVKTGNKITKIDPATGIASQVDEVQNKLTRRGEERIKDELKMKLDAAVKVALKAETDKKFEKLKLSANEKVSFGEQVQAKQTSGSFDVRKIDKLVSGKLGGLGTKARIGLISAVAMGIRMGMKSGKVQTGDSKGDLIKDIGETVSNALKGVSFNLPSGGGGDHGHDKPSGGAAGHGADDHH